MKEAASIYTTLSRRFLAALFFCSLVLCPGLLDLTLVPRFAAFSAFAIVILSGLYKSKAGFEAQFDLPLLAYVAYFVFSVASVFWAHTTSEALFESAKLWLAFLAFLFTLLLLRKQGAAFRATLIQVSMAAATVTIIATALQLWHVKSLAKESMYLVTGINSHKNLLSSFLFLSLLFLSLAFLYLDRLWKIAAGLCMALALALLILLRTKAVWLGLVAFGATGALIQFFLVLKRQMRYKLSPGLMIATLMLAANFFFLIALPFIVQESVRPAMASSKISAVLDQERLMVWHKSYQIMAGHRFFGLGLGNWQIYFPNATLTGLWRAEDLGVTFQRPHNDFLWILCETGFVGFNLYLLLIIALVVRVLNTLDPDATDKRRNRSIILTIGSLAGFMVISFFDFPKERMEHLLWLNVIFAMLYFYAGEKSGRMFFKIRLSRSSIAVAGLISVFVLIFGLQRGLGELYTRQLYDFMKANRTKEMIKSGYKAQSIAYSVDPTTVPIYWYTGNAQASLLNLDRALKDFKLAYKFAPYNRNVLNDLASAIALRGDTAQAIGLYREAVRISPRFDNPRLNLAAIYLNRREYALAQNCLDSLLHDSPRRDEYMRALRILRKTAPEAALVPQKLN